MTKKIDLDKVRIEVSQEELRKICFNIVDLFELNEIPVMNSIIGMWNVIHMAFQERYKITYQEFEKVINALLEESKQNWNND